MPHVTLIHGIANKPDRDSLHTLWLRYLTESGGLDLEDEGVTSTMVYWADVLYPTPKQIPAEHESNDSFLEKTDPDISMDWRGEAEEGDSAWVEQLAGRLGLDQEPPGGDEDFEAPLEGIGTEFERIPLPWWLKKRLMKRLLRDVHHYLFNVEHSPRPDESYQVQDEIRDRMVRALKDGAERPGPHVVISHSMGTVIAYDCLKSVEGSPSVDGLVTIGSPLGLDEVQDKLKPGWSKDDAFPEKVPAWVNVYDRLDPVAGLDAKIASDYKRGGRELVVDVNEQNEGKWRHNIGKYLSGPKLVGHLRTLLDLD